MADEQTHEGEPFLLERTYTEPNIKNVVADAVGIVVFAFLIGYTVGRSDFWQLNVIASVILAAIAGIMWFVILILDLKHMTYRALNQRVPYRSVHAGRRKEE